MAAERRIEGEGTTAAEWSTWLAQSSALELNRSCIIGPDQRLMIVAPHPDDEVLGGGGLISLHASDGGKVEVVAVTDGEASHAGSPGHEPELLRATRHQERQAGLARLGVKEPVVHRLGISDGRVQSEVTPLAAMLVALLRRDDVVLTTWEDDGHPDHEASGQAARLAANRVGCALWQMPVWMWHWAHPADDRVPWHRLRTLRISARAVAAKKAALNCHASQLSARAADQPAVVTPAMVARTGWPAEFFIESPR